MKTKTGKNHSVGLDAKIAQIFPQIKKMEEEYAIISSKKDDFIALGDLASGHVYMLDPLDAIEMDLEDYLINVQNFVSENTSTVEQQENKIIFFEVRILSEGGYCLFKDRRCAYCYGKMRTRESFCYKCQRKV